MKIDTGRKFEGEDVELDFIDNREEKLPLKEIIDRVANHYGVDIIAVKRAYFNPTAKPKYVGQFTRVVMEIFKDMPPELDYEGKVDDFIFEPKTAVIGGSGVVSLHSLLLRSHPPFLRAG